MTDHDQPADQPAPDVEPAQEGDREPGADEGDLIDEQGEESFPASDPPSNW